MAVGEIRLKYIKILNDARVKILFDLNIILNYIMDF